MRIELLVFDGWPNWEAARELFRAGMASLGISGEIQEIQVKSLEQAQALNFPGSPTLRVNGQDVAPLPEGFQPAMGCRTYGVQGRRQGLPDVAWIVEALRKAQEVESHSCCTPLAKPKTVASCPACGIEGKPVKPVTLRSLLQPHLRVQVQDELYRFCSSRDCALVYYSSDGSQTFARADLTVRVGVKENSAPRPLCYCFGHSAESIREEWVQTGSSTALESIKDAMKAGTCRCEVMNPSGGCCLGDVTKEVKAMAANTETSAQTHDCCASVNPSNC